MKTRGGRLKGATIVAKGDVERHPQGNTGNQSRR
jgi:hypothetical protein